MNLYKIAPMLTIMASLPGCIEENHRNAIKFATSAEYPPFEYHEGGTLKGFDIELAQLVAKELHSKAIFEDMQFSTILAALQSGSVDAAISTITITKEREENFDFSDSYYTESMAIVYPQKASLADKAQFFGKKIACQLGTTMEIWLKKHFPTTEILAMNNNNQAIEALKAGYVDGVLIDSVQAQAFTQKNPMLSYAIVGRSDAGYGIAITKGSPLKEKINAALKILEINGELEKLKQKWFGGISWEN